eukprot:TRINITY_DN19933_c0_g3_i2.p1 TRINITY_DN19933_c0_g3~~TRINITY_DN19933_c0_g3_i2.p1  ORF type:complete len:205 (+),score=31.24 TRINITY_DN19933_c0_g3_i2:66-680(+)
MKLEIRNPSQASRTVMWFLEYVEKDCEVEEIEPSETTKEEFLQGNPFGCVPVLTDGDVKITQSSAILEYLAEGKFPMPTDAVSSARVTEYFGVHCSLVTKLTTECFDIIKACPASEQPSRIEACGKHVSAILKRFEDTLSRQHYVAGEDLTLADFLFVCEIDQLQNFGLLDAYPNITAYVTVMEKVKGYQKHFDAFEAAGKENK